MKVKVYFNLHKKCFSIQHKGKVIGYADAVTLKDCQFKVSESGRQRVLREKRKNVHAYCIGEWVDSANKSAVEYALLTENWAIANPEAKSVTYNPYKYGSFVDKRSEQPIVKSDAVLLDCKTIWAI